MPASLPRLLTTVVLFALLPAIQNATAQAPPAPPDLTAGGQRPANAEHDWNLGATGARGWMHSEKLVTSRARQIAITEVAKGSPADSILAPGDVLLGAGGRRFAHDPRTELGQALTAAETEEGNGRLELLRWRAGETSTVTVQLPVLGTYSRTAPFDCPKSQRILQQGCKALAARMAQKSYRAEPIVRSLNALALLASGDQEHLPLLRREAGWAAQFTADGLETWHNGYVGILLAEYVLATGDRSVLPGLKRIALEAAHGQSRVGSWGHRYALPDGRLGGYGMMNSPGIPLTIALVLAREAGVDDPALDRAITRSQNLLRFYVGKGAVPYGDHDPWIEAHEDNGKCGMAAVLFDLLGDGEAATFFSRMGTASHGAERDTGHTGNFFNLLWAMPGIARSGPSATGAWMQEYGAWYFDLARRWDGSFAHQGPPEEKNDKYARWDATGAYLLACAMPLQKLRLTGARPSSAMPVDEASAAALIKDGRGWNNRDRVAAYMALDRTELLQRLRSWSPVVRERAALALTREREAVVPDLVAMLAEPDLHARLGACQALARLGERAGAAVPALRECLQHPDLWLRVKAAQALGRIGKASMPVLPELLATLARTPEDPRGMEQRYLCFVLFDRREGLLRRSLDGVDRDALRAAIRAGLRNEDGRARSALETVYGQLTLEELRPLLPDILAATVESAPSGIMFADGIRMAGLELLASHRIEEGLAACVHYLRHQKQHGSEKRVPEVLAILQRYGAHAQVHVPELLRIADFFEREEQDFPKKLSLAKATAVREAVRRIEQATDKPALIRIQ